MSYDDLRKGRVSLAGHAYLITAVTQDRKPCFNKPANAEVLRLEFNRIEERKEARNIAWVIMPDHIHWLLQLDESETLSAVMRNLKGRSSRRISEGKLWQRAYHDRAVRPGEDIKDMARYIIANPLRAGLVQNVKDYRWWWSQWYPHADRPDETAFDL